MTRRRAIVWGRVQGVGFRYFCRETAEERGIRGWVRNNPNGTVELEAEADEPALDEFLERLKTGNPWARVERIDSSPVSPKGDAGEGFEIVG